jgi:hypothetical protein
MARIWRFGSFLARLDITASLTICAALLIWTVVH